MYRKALAVVVAALVSAVLLGLLGACGVSAEDSIESITTTQQTSEGIPITNYRVNYTQTPEEWQALSSEDKQKLAQLGFDKVLEQVAADATSTFTAVGVTADSDTADSELAVFLNRDQSVLLVYGGVDNSATPAQPILVTEIPVELP
jgi:acetylglutamate synthase